MSRYRASRGPKCAADSACQNDLDVGLTVPDMLLARADEIIE
jgi:hypothetical protein